MGKNKGKHIGKHAQLQIETVAKNKTKSNLIKNKETVKNKNTKNKRYKSKKTKARKCKNNKILINRLKVLIVLILLIIAIIIINKKVKNKEEIQKELNLKEEILGTVETDVTAVVLEYIVYGTHMNLEGTMDFNETVEKPIKSVKIVYKTSGEDESIIDTNYTLENNVISFSTGENINEGIDLEELTSSAYLLLKIQYEDSEVEYYSFKNSSNYGNTEYYSITKNNTNNKIYINFDEYNSISYLNLNVSQVSQLPDDVYDVVIDAGHGGADAGATSGTYYESEIMLECAKILKTKLESLGLKVFLTRDGTEDEDADMAYDMYDDDGRVTIAMEAHAKILISLHLNSNEEYLTTGGVEVYCPSNVNLSFATLLAYNIVNMANTNYSYLETYKETDGVYIHNFSEYEIAEARKSAIKLGYEPYDSITTSTPYLFIIRETGGIATEAFVDGRNPYYGTNKYYNSNVGIESYLVELGYINVSKDLQNILNNENLYMEAIAQTIQSCYL